jgi:putative oxidoreductase
MGNPVHCEIAGEKCTGMKIGVLLARLLLGLVFAVFGLNGFLHFIPTPPSIPGDAGVFFGVLTKTHYVYLTAGVQCIAGVLLLADQYVPLALVLLAGMLVNILTFHITMMPQGLLMPIVVTILWFIVSWSIRGHFAPLFVRKVD